MLYNKYLALAIIFGFLIIASILFAAYGYSNNTDLGIMIKTDMNMIFYSPAPLQTSILSNTSETIAILGKKEYRINNFEGEHACIDNNTIYIVGLGMYSKYYLIELGYNGNYTKYEFNYPITGLLCNNQIYLIGDTYNSSFISEIGKTNTTTIFIYYPSLLGIAPSSIISFNNSYFISYDDNYVVVYKNGIANILSFNNATIYNFLINNNDLYFLGSYYVNDSYLGLVYNYNNGNGHLIYIKGTQGFIDIASPSLNGFSVLYRSIGGYAYFIYVIYNKTYPAVIGMSYTFSLYQDGSYNKGIWLAGNMEINSNSYNLGLFINGTLNGYVGNNKITPVWISSSLPFIKSQFETVNISFSSIQTKSSSIEYQNNISYGNAEKISTLTPSYLMFQVNKYIILGTSLIIAIILSLVIYLTLSKSFNW